MKKVTLIAPLSRIHCSPPIKLSSDIEIYAMHPGLENVIKDAREKGVVRHPGHFTHSLVVRNVENTLDTSNLRAELEEVILRLRIFKSGDIGFSFVNVDREGWYDRYISASLSVQATLKITYELIGVFFYIVWDRPGLASIYEILSQDIEPLRKLISQTANLKLMHRPSSATSFLDIMSHMVQIVF